MSATIVNASSLCAQRFSAGYFKLNVATPHHHPLIYASSESPKGPGLVRQRRWSSHTTKRSGGSIADAHVLTSRCASGTSPQKQHKIGKPRCCANRYVVLSLRRACAVASRPTPACPHCIVPCSATCSPPRTKGH